MTQTIATLQGSKEAADKDAIRPFPKVNVPELELTDLRSRINATRWPERETVTIAFYRVADGDWLLSDKGARFDKGCL
jgi:hypothetical protein